MHVRRDGQTSIGDFCSGAYGAQQATNFASHRLAVACWSGQRGLNRQRDGFKFRIMLTMLIKQARLPLWDVPSEPACRQIVQVPGTSRVVSP
jgi:hypothetical protein